MSERELRLKVEPDTSGMDDLLNELRRAKLEADELGVAVIEEMFPEADMMADAYTQYLRGAMTQVDVREILEGLGDPHYGEDFDLYAWEEMLYGEDFDPSEARDIALENYMIDSGVLSPNPVTRAMTPHPQTAYVDRNFETQYQYPERAAEYNYLLEAWRGLDQLVPAAEPEEDPAAMGAAFGEAAGAALEGSLAAGMVSSVQEAMGEADAWERIRSFGNLPWEGSSLANVGAYEQYQAAVTGAPQDQDYVTRLQYQLEVLGSDDIEGVQERLAALNDAQDDVWMKAEALDPAMVKISSRFGELAEKEDPTQFVTQAVRALSLAQKDGALSAEQMADAEMELYKAFGLASDKELGAMAALQNYITLYGSGQMSAEAFALAVAGLRDQLNAVPEDKTVRVTVVLDEQGMAGPHQEHRQVGETGGDYVPQAVGGDWMVRGGVARFEVGDLGGAERVQITPLTVHQANNYERGGDTIIVQDAAARALVAQLQQKASRRRVERMLKG